MMGHISVSGLSYLLPSGENTFFDISFTASPGEHVGLVGINGVGKSTISHDRTFFRKMYHYLFLDDDGVLLDIADYDVAMAMLAGEAMATRTAAITRLNVVTPQ
ncbi:MAG: ATP-binding cassette domain-containing protein [Micromonosporaceae bacterium]|nr:ATP-binding cassette domain-containing protein [Micromonosporaceae bacterium]